MSRTIRTAAAVALAVLGSASAAQAQSATIGPPQLAAPADVEMLNISNGAHRGVIGANSELAENDYEPAHNVKAPFDGIVTKVSWYLTGRDALVVLAGPSSRGGFKLVRTTSPREGSGMPKLMNYTNYNLKIGAGQFLGLWATKTPSVAVKYRAETRLLRMQDPNTATEGSWEGLGTFQAPVANELADYAVQISATVERDSDCDGKGDVTQDTSIGTPKASCGY